MIDTTSVTQDRPERLTVQVDDTKNSFWRSLALGAILLVSVFMNFYQLGQNGFGNTYYAAGIRSMADNLHNFFFVSFDPGGFVTIDKPPLGFWLQVVSVKLFGFTAFAIFLPQALAGVLSVLLLYVLVRRYFGAVAGLLAALALAISPISVVTNRNNTIDSTLTLTMLIAAWVTLKAAQTGKLRWLLLVAVIVGLGFNIKMAEAFLVVPALGLLYLLASPRTLWVRIGHLALALLLMLALSFAWLVAVDVTPASLRPYVGSTQNNSEISLATGYNGLQRLLGGFGRGFGGGNRSVRTSDTGTGSRNTGTTTTNSGNNGLPANPQGGNGQPGTGGTTNGTGTGRNGTRFNPGNFGGGGFFGTGSAGVFRLFEGSVGTQIGWLLPMALLGLLALAWQSRPRFQSDKQQQSMILWGTWMLTEVVFFSVAGMFHTYYLTTLAPSICALFGIGIAIMWQDYRQAGWRGWLLPIALIATALEQIYLLSTNPSWGTWLIPVIAIACALAALVLIVARLLPRININTRILVPALGVGVLSLLLVSAVWSTTPVLQGAAPDIPSAGPSGDGGFGGGFGGGNASNTDAALINYLEAHQGNAKYLVATTNANTAAPIILATNKPVMAMGGFTGSDPILTTTQLSSLVANGTVRFFLLDGRGGGFQPTPQQLEQIRERFGDEFPVGGPGGASFGGPGGQSSLTSWVTQHCKAVPSSSWQSSTSTGTTGRGGFGGGGQLYDCASAK